jgi:hypothetical protein
MSDKMIGREIAERLNAGKHVSGPWELHHYMSEHGERWIIEKIQQPTRHAAEVERLRKLCGEAEEFVSGYGGEPAAELGARLCLAGPLEGGIDRAANAAGRGMKHARADYDSIQDVTAAVKLARIVLDMGLITDKGTRAKELAREVLGIAHADGADAVRDWAVRAEYSGADPEIVRVAREHAMKMEAWPKKKVPDLPRTRRGEE